VQEITDLKQTHAEEIAGYNEGADAHAEECDELEEQMEVCIARFLNTDPI
jgi:hypothetical protein